MIENKWMNEEKIYFNKSTRSLQAFIDTTENYTFNELQTYLHQISI